MSGKNKLASISEFMSEALYTNPVNESLFAEERVDECVVAARKLSIDAEGKVDTTETPSFVLVKNRDRSYNVNCSIVRKIVNGVETVVLLDTDTTMMEGMNEFGVGIVNASLSLADENVGTSKGKDKDKDKGLISRSKFAADGEKILHALSMSNIDDSIHMAKTWKNGIHGNTLIATDDELYTISSTSIHPAVTSKLDGLDLVVFTNHSDVHSSAGYQPGSASYKSSATRKTKAEEFLADATTPEEMGAFVAKQPFAKNSQLNPRRSTNTLATSTTMVLDLKNLHFHLILYKEFVENFKGIVDELPTGYEPKIKITFEEKK